MAEMNGAQGGEVVFFVVYLALYWAFLLAHVVKVCPGRLQQVMIAPRGSSDLTSGRPCQTRTSRATDRQGHV
jgi:hypothetical protein